MDNFCNPQNPDISLFYITGFIVYTLPLGR